MRRVYTSHKGFLYLGAGLRKLHQASKKEGSLGTLSEIDMKRLFWRSSWLIVFMFWGIVSLPTIATARPPGSSHPHEGRLERLVETLGLDEDTLAKVNTVIESSKAEHQALRRKLREAHERMRSLLEQENPDEAAVMAQADTIGALKTEAQKQRLRTMLQVRAFLTPEQRTKLLELLRTRPPRRSPREPCPQKEP
jgi:Spy/CpxP family protein refolding chaperone